MNEALPNTEFREHQPSNGYNIDWAIETNGGTGHRDDDPHSRTPGSNTVQEMSVEFHGK